MTIDGINISSFGLRVEDMTGEVSLPARKRVLAEPGTMAKDIVFQENEIKITMFGRYASLIALRTGVEGLKDLIKLNLVHTFIRASHGLNLSGVIKNGVKVEVLNKVATVTFTITVTE